MTGLVEKYGAHPYLTVPCSSTLLLLQLSAVPEGFQHVTGLLVLLWH